MAKYEIRPEFARAIRWFGKGQYAAGAKVGEPDCLCSLCNQVVGLPEGDPHFDDCDSCETCEDQVPIMLFRGEARNCEIARFHGRCFGRILRVKSVSE